MHDDEHHWTHPQCYDCWLKKWGLSRIPTRVLRDDETPCCSCNKPTSYGIYQRVQPGSSEIPYCPDQQINRDLFWPATGDRPVTGIEEKVDPQ